MGAKIFKPENEFIEIPSAPGQHGEPAIRGKGPRIWILVAYSKHLNMTPEQIHHRWRGQLTLEEVQAALDYAEKYPQLVDDRWDWEED